MELTVKTYGDDTVTMETVSPRTGREWERDELARMVWIGKRVDQADSAEDFDEALHYLETNYVKSEIDWVIEFVNKMREQRNVESIEWPEALETPGMPQTTIVDGETVVTPRPRREKRTRAEINDKEVRHTADCIVELVGDGVMSKGEIMREFGDAAPRVSLWNKAIALLIESKELQINGQKKGARYSKYGKAVTIKRLLPESDEVTEAKAEVLKMLTKFKGTGPLGRSEIFTHTGTIDQPVWIMAVKELIAEGKVVQTGIKRGAKYEAI